MFVFGRIFFGMQGTFLCLGAGQLISQSDEEVPFEGLVSQHLEGTGATATAAPAPGRAEQQEEARGRPVSIEMIGVGETSSKGQSKAGLMRVGSGV